TAQPRPGGGADLGEQGIRRLEHRRPAEHRRTGRERAVALVEKRCGAVQDAHLPERQAERVRRATAGHYGGDGDPNWGAVAGAGILGALLGAATVPQPQPQIIVVVPQPAPPLPSYSPPTSSPMWWCGASRRWYPDVFACAVPWTHW